MKNIKQIFKAFSLLFMLLIAASCVQDDEFSTPDVSYEEPNVDVNTSIKSIKEMYQGFEPVKIEAGPDSQDPMYIEAYVVSSDESGNIYKTIVIQDKPENPEHGISISTEATDSYLTYDIGRKIYFRVDGLYVGEYAGLPTIGTDEGDEIGRISEAEFYDRILRSNDKAEIIPTLISIDEVGDEYLNTLIQFENVQFSDDEVGKSYGNLDNTFSVNRLLTTCEGDNSIIVRNSGFSNFKNLPLPTGNGKLTAILNVFNGTYQLTLRNQDDVAFDNERCGALYKEDFESYDDFSDAEAAGWMSVSVNGTVNYIINEFNNDKYAQISGFNSNQPDIDTYLISPAINLDGSTSEVLSFNLEVAYANGVILKVLVTDNFTGDVTTTNWDELNVTIPNTPSNGFGGFNNYNGFDLSSYNGDIRIAFLYEGADPTGTASDMTTRYHIDDITILGN